jgi:hypothetical protein
MCLCKEQLKNIFGHLYTGIFFLLANKFWVCSIKIPLQSFLFCLCTLFPHLLAPMRPKARGLAQHNGPPGWLE